MDRTKGHVSRGHIIANPSVALVVVTAEMRRHGNWGDPTVDQLTQVGRVLDDDQHGRLTRDQAVTRLRSIGGWTPDEAA